MKSRILWCLMFAASFAAFAFVPATRSFALSNLAVQLVIFLVFANRPAWRDNRLSYVDFAWPAGLAAIGVQVALFAPALDALDGLVALIYAFMGVRMAVWARHLYRPGALARDLPRYEYQRKRWQRAGFRSEGFSVQYEILVQAMANMAFLAAPAYLVAADITPLGAWHLACAALWLAAYAFESTADWQKRRFARSDAGRAKGVCEVGLWRYSRHPNYFGQWVQWIALALLAAPSLIALHGEVSVPALVVFAWSLAWAVYLMHGTLVYYTGAVPSEFFSLRKRPAYADYQARVNRFVPGPRKNFPRGE